MLCKMVTRRRFGKLMEIVASEDTNPGKKAPRKREDHIAEKGFNSINHYNLAHQFIPMPQAMKIPDAKAAVDKEWQKLETIPAWQWEKLKSRGDAIMEAQKREKESPLCHIDGHLSSQECGVGTKAPKVQRTSHAPR